MTDVAAKTRCRALIAGFGRPGMRDLDFGHQLVRYLEGLSWPEGVVVEDLSYAAPLVLHRLQELEPAKVLLVGAAARNLDPPGALRRYRVDLMPPGPEEVQRSLEESVQGVVDLDHTLAVARHWGGLPCETVVIEVEPADCSFGVGFSEQLAASFDPILAMVREELASCDDDSETALFDVALDRTYETSSAAVVGEVVVAEPSDALMDLVRFARRHEEVRRLEPHRGEPLADRLPDPDAVAVTGRSQPWGVGLDSGSDWFDVIPLEGGGIGVVMGDVGRRGVEGAAAMADLRAAVRAYVVTDGDSPARVLGQLDRLARTTAIGKNATLVYLALEPSTGELRLGNAGHCPPLLLEPHGAVSFVREALSRPLGAAPGSDRPEARLDLAPGSTLLLFTDGLACSRTRSTAEGLEVLRRAAADGPAPLDALCDHVMRLCTHGLRRDNDISLLGLRLPLESAPRGIEASSPASPPPAG